MKKAQHSQGVEGSDINISPLIDMVFILLIFFIVTTVFVEETGLRAETPSDVSPPDDKDPIVIRIAASGDVTHEGVVLQSGGVAATIRAAAKLRSPTVLISVEEGSLANTIVRVLDEAKIAGAGKVSLTSVSR